MSARAFRDRLSAPRMRLALELALARHGLWIALGTLFAAASAWLVLGLLPAQSRELAQLAARSTQAAGAPAPSAPQDPLAPFRAVLRPDAEKTAVARALWNAAAEAGLQPARVDYRSNPATPAGFARFDLTLPVTGSPTVIRRFAFSLLERYPGLALEKIELQRESAMQDTVEAQLAFVLLLEARE
ncbi:hypothetical protein GCM10025771_09210 [Niveibacterium umoris]|uniref:Type II secretion system protein M n=1 Tax=Niveibacterium umoris TaxID=1193620 RepID=A0A840BKM4_9RHOO|nr:hypothetical protein [Niveibacterium umoris]MBB4013530.1 hypothetical protein [Niveibacterium umoris]